MELNLQSLASECCATAIPFVEGDRIHCSLVRRPDGDIVRIDLLASAVEGFEWPGEPLCHWNVVYQPEPPPENIERDVRLTAENFFVELTSAGEEQPVENGALVQFLALMLERKRVLRSRGLSDDGRWKLYEHMGSRTEHRVPVGEISAESLLAIRDKLEVVLGVSAPGAQTAEEAGARPGPADHPTES